jgi:DNA primase
VRGLHRRDGAGIPRAVATCGTALTGDHVKLLRRFAARVVLAFDADGAGQAAADRFYAWEKEFGVDVAVAKLPSGADPADLARTDPAALAAAVTDAVPFLRFRLDRTLAAARTATPEDRARAAEAAIAVISEHPNPLVREQYASDVATRLGMRADRLADLSRRGVRVARVEAEPVRPQYPQASSERTVLWLLVHEWDRTAPWVIPEMFTDPVHQAALEALGEHDSIHLAIEHAPPEAAELLRVLAVEPNESVDPRLDAFALLKKVAFRQLAAVRPSDWVGVVPTSGMVKSWIDDLPDGERAEACARELLGWVASGARSVEEAAV